MRISRPRRRKSSINITSLIDVLFLLLIFFMLSSTFKEQPGMLLELPESESSEQIEIRDLILNVERTGEQSIRLQLDKDIIGIEQLADHLRKLGDGLSEATTLTLKADRSVDHGTIVHIMDIAKRSGIKKLVIATRLPRTDE